MERLNPAAVAGGIRFSRVSPGSLHTCGVSTGNVAYCCGYDYYGQLGEGGPFGDAAPNQLSPVAVAGRHLFASVSTGRTHTCGVTVDGAGYCWGANGPGALGDGTDVSSSAPVAVAGPS